MLLQCLRDDLANRLAELDLQALVAGDFEGAGVEAELGEHGGVDVGDVGAWRVGNGSIL